MKLIIGLGNPEKKHKKTRHNVGFLIADHIQKNISGFSNWQLKKKLKSEISENKELGIILAKPQTYMNSSGEAVIKIVSSFKFQVSSLYVVHDDFDLPLGEYKLEKDRGSAGHKGVQSIIDHLKTKDFWRLRVGIRPSFAEATEGKPDQTQTKADLLAKTSAKAEDFVLKKFSKEEEKIIEETIPRAAKELIK